MTSNMSVLDTVSTQDITATLTIFMGEDSMMGPICSRERKSF